MRPLIEFVDLVQPEPNVRSINACHEKIEAKPITDRPKIESDRKNLFDSRPEVSYQLFRSIK